MAIAYLAALAVPIWLGLRRGGRRAGRGVTEPGRLIDHGQIMDPDRLDRAVD